MSEVILETPLTKLLGCKHPVMQAGMYSVAGHKLCAAVSNAGGFGSIGGLSYTPKMLRKEIRFVKELLTDNQPFGVDFLLPKVGDGARKTNYDYTGGKLDILLDILIDEKVKLFISAVGVPPKWAVDKLHAANIVCMNMIGAPHHVKKALDVGMDIICAQGTEAGGHTGNIATMPLIPQVVDICKGRKNYFGTEVPVVAAGGFYEGRGLAAAFCLGASGLWVGTRFLASKEASASKFHKDRVIAANSIDTTTSIIFTGRPARVLRTPYVKSWEERPGELKKLISEGIVPFAKDIKEGNVKISEGLVSALGQCAGGITEILPAKVILDSMVSDAISSLQKANTFSKL